MKILGLIILIILSVLALFLAVCLFIKLSLVLRLSKPRDGKCSFDAQISSFGGHIVKKFNTDKSSEGHKSKDDKNKSEDKNEADFNLTDKVKKYYNTFLKIRYTWLRSKKKVRKNIFCSKLFLNIKFGLEDAAKTGMATGAIWTALYNVIAFLSNFMRLTEPEIHVNPIFDEEYIEADSECIIDFRLVNIISILITVGINYYLVNKKLTKKEKAAINYGKSD